MRKHIAPATDCQALVFKGDKLVLSGGIVTDHGNSDSKVDVSECLWLYNRKLVKTPAVSGLATADTKHIVIDPADNTVKSVSSATGTVDLATVALSANVCTPPMHRRRVPFVTANEL